MKKYTLFIILALAICPVKSEACTSMIISAERSASGRPLLWKHRDTGADNNFLAKVEATDTTAGYVGLFNAGDSLLSEAWMGMNDRGFAIMNTASYNVADLESDLCDREAVIMSRALQVCTTVDDFEHLLDTLPKPLGVQANFGVIDGIGGAAYFETDDRKWVRYNVADSEDGYLIRTNHSISGSGDKGQGYIRYATAAKLAKEIDKFSPSDLTEGFSRQFYHSLLGRDCFDDSIIMEFDYIPRDISTASLVVEGVTPVERPDEIRMWGCLGYPPCGISRWTTLSYIPEEFQPTGPEWRSEACDRAMQLRQTAIPLATTEGKRYLDLTKLRPVIRKCIEESKNFVTLPKN